MLWLCYYSREIAEEWGGNNVGIALEISFVAFLFLSLPHPQNLVRL